MIKYWLLLALLSPLPFVPEASRASPSDTVDQSRNQCAYLVLCLSASPQAVCVIPAILCPESVASSGDEVLNRIAAESEGNKEKRRHLRELRETLVHSLRDWSSLEQA